MKKNLLIIAVGLFLQINLQSQQETHQISFVAKSYPDSVVLRWGIDHINAWDLSRAAGYYIERMELDDKSNQVNENFIRLTERAIRPWTKEEFHERTVKGDSMTALAYKCLYQASDEAKRAKDFIKQLSMISADRNSRFTMSMMAADMSVKAANSLGLRFVDRNTKPGVKYIYRIFSPIDSSSVALDSTYLVIRSDQYYQEQAMLKPDVYSGDRQILIRWLTQNKYSGYFLERSSDGKNFRPISKGPIIPWLNEKGKPFEHLTFNDSIPMNDKTYYYRIRGITAFAELSPWSQAAEISGKDGFTLNPPRIIAGENKIGLQMDLSWLADDSYPIAGFYVSHAHNGFSKNFTPVHDQILPAETRSFTHFRPSEYEGNSYRITVIYENGMVYSSLPYHAIVKDQAPPAKPLGLIGEINKQGIVSLAWNSNEEYDLKGYFVLRANQADHEFMNLTPYVIQESNFIDTVNLNTLTEKTYYTIQAKDKSGKLSAFSDTLFIKRPDIIPPSAPVIKDFKVVDSSLLLSWNQSTSADLDHHILVMRKVGGEWQRVETFEKGVSSASIVIPESGIVEFALYAVDDSNLESEKCFPVGVRAVQKKVKLDIQNFRVERMDDSKCRLSWLPGFEVNKGKYVLYRSVNGSPLRRHKILKADEVFFEDTGLEIGNAYAYELQFRSDLGLKSSWEKSRIIMK